MSDRSWFRIHPAFGLRKLSSVEPVQLAPVDERDMPPRWRQLGGQVTDPIEEGFFRGLLEHFAREKDARVLASLLLLNMKSLDLDRELDRETVDMIVDSAMQFDIEVVVGGEPVMIVVDGWTGVAVSMDPGAAEELLAPWTW